MPYYIGDVIKDARKLTARTPEKFREGGIEIIIDNGVAEVDERRQEVILADGKALPYDILALGTGTEALRPGIPGEDREGVFLLRKLTDALTIKSYLEATGCRRAIVIGAGFIAMEACEAFVTRGIETEMIHRGKLPVARWDAELSSALLEEIKRRGVIFTSETTLTSIVEGAAYRLRLNTNRGPREADIILIATGVRPDTRLARAMGLTIGASGAIAVNFSQRTCRENVYAAGDCCESYHRVSRRWVNIPLGDIANKQGRVAGSNIGGTPRIFPGVVGAQSFRIFSWEAAAAGVTEREAATAGFHPISDVFWGNATAGSMPGPKKIGLKLIADRATGRLLGAQAVGEQRVVGRINTLAAALWAGLAIDELGYIDLAYSPPFSGAWDVIHLAAQNLLRKM
ncbi:MAG: FAD-dependent oxidoreductase [Pseudomonadota bacterium]|nr:FAD-dependent oxidoreductase [Pseudomonadota bacterium]